MARAPRMHRRLLLGGILLLAGTLGVLLVGGLFQHEPRAPRKADPRPRRRTTQPKTPGPKRTLVLIEGVVRETDGLPLSGATVYVLPKKRPGGDRDDVPHEVTDARGAWDLHIRGLKETWVGVVAPGYRTIWLDGDGLDPGHPIEMALERAPALEVTVRRADGSPVAEKGVQLEAWPPGGTYWCPGPQCRRGEQWGVTDEQGTCTFRVAVPGPVTLTAYVENHESTPRKLWLPDATGRVEIVVRPNATLGLDFRPSAAFGDTDDLVTTEFFEAGTGRRAFAFTEAMQRPGTLDLERALRPGTYDLRVSMPGWADVLLPQVTVPIAAPAARLEIAMAAAPEPARVALLLEGNQATRPRGTRLRAPLVYVLREEEPWVRLGWQLAAPEAWEPARARIALQLAAGTWRVMVSDVLTGRAASTERLALTSGASQDVPLPMHPGQVADVPPVHQGSVYVVDLEARGPGGERLPIFGSNRDGSLRYREAVDLLAQKLVGADVVLGPYPMDEFTMRVIRSDQSIEDVAVR